jgi:DNA-binding transcriptional LysR family regulator
MQYESWDLLSCLSMLDLRRLAVFREVADQASFSAAALELGYTQSVVSHHVAQLEREVGVTLVERGRRPVRLTPAGERLHAHAGTILGASRAAEADLRAVAGLAAGTLRIGAFLTACASFVPAAIGAFTSEHPGVDVRLDQLEPPASVPRLIDGELDLAVVFIDEDRAQDPRLESRKLADDPYRVALPPGHRLARRRQVRLAELRDERFCAPRPQGGGLQYRAMLERLCEPAGFAPDFAYAVNDVTVARGFVAAGLAVAVMPDMTIPHPRPDVAVKPLADIEPSRTVHALWVRDRLTPGIRPMVAALEGAAPRLVARAGM